MPRLPEILKSFTASDANRAIYIDFEGLGRSPQEKVGPKPSLLGVLSPGGYTAYFLEKGLAPLLKGRQGFKELGIEKRIVDPDLDRIVEEMTERANREKRMILYFSPHEQVMIDAYCDSAIATEFKAVSANAKRLIDRWAVEARPNKRHQYEKNLDDYCKLAGKPKWCPIPPAPGPAETIRRLRRACARTRRWSKLKPIHQELTRELLAYNRSDCWALRRLTKMAINSLSR